MKAHNSSAYGCFLWGILMLVLGFSHAPVFSDPDTAWHLAAGDLIRSLYHIPRHDTWSFTGQEEYWYNLSWLYDAITSLLFQYFGFSSLFVLTIAVFATSITLIATHCVSRGASMVLVSLYVICITIPITHIVLLARPAMLSLLFAVCSYRLLWQVREQANSLCVMAIGVGMMLWVNMHGGFLLGLLLVLVFLAEAALQKDHARMRRLSLVLAVTLVATLLNPYSLGVYYGAYRTLASAYNATLTEWQATSIGTDGPMTLLFLLVLWLCNAQDKKLPLVDRLLMPLIFTMAMNALRHSAAAALLAMPYLTLRATSLLEDGRLATWIKARDTVILRDMVQRDIRIMGVVLAVVTACIIATPYPRDMWLAKPLGFPDTFPSAEAEYAAIHYPTYRFMNDYNIGGYLDYIWRGTPKLFIDGRANSLFSEEVLQDYLDFIKSGGWGKRADTIAQYYHIDGVIVTHDTEMTYHWRDSPDWKEVYRGKVATVYVKANKPEPSESKLDKILRRMHLK